MIKDSVNLIRVENERELCILKKNIPYLKKELKSEYIQQKEKNLLKRKQTRTLKEIRITIGIFEVLQMDQVIEADEDIVMFVTKDYELLLEI